MGGPGINKGSDRWEAVLFDLDGTLADTIELILRSFRHAMTAHLGESPPDERWLSTIGRPLRDSMRLFARSPREAEAMTDTYVGFQRVHHDELVVPYPGILELVSELVERETPLGVVTSKRREMALRTLGVCGLTGRFPVVVTADDVEVGKPDPGPVLLCLDRLGVAPGERVVFVGDSTFDLRAGRGAGVATAAALWGPIPREELAREEPDYWVRQPLEMLSISPGGRRG